MALYRLLVHHQITISNIGNSSFSIIKSSGTLTVTASDGYGNDASQVVKDKVQNFSDLPVPAINNQVVQVTGDADRIDDYYGLFQQITYGKKQ